MKRRRRRWTPDEKLQIIREARQSDAAVADVCRRHGITPGTFYSWEKRAEQGALKALQRKRRSRDGAREQQLESQLQELRAAVTELLTENLRLKKGRWP